MRRIGRILSASLVLVATAFVGACESYRPNPIALGDDRWIDRPSDATIAAWPLDMRLDVAIERIVELRGRAARGDAVAQARLGRELDAEEAELWRARQAERARLALSRLAADGVVDGAGVAKVARDDLRSRLEEARGWTLGPRLSRHFEDLSTLGGSAMRRQADRERAIALAEIAILRRLIAPPDPPNPSALQHCNELPIPGRPSACVRGPGLADGPASPGCAALAQARAEPGPRREAYEILCRDGVVDPDGRARLNRARLTDRIDIAERVALDGLIDSARRARAAEEVALLRALQASAPSE